MKFIKLPEHFYFTQHSISTFEKCPLKFWKRYIENLKWKSFPSEEIKLKIEAGNDFHLLSSRYFNEVPAGVEFLTEQKAFIKKWYDNLVKCFPIEGGVIYKPEYKLRVDLGSYRLEANYDLLVQRGNELHIWDWKTGNKKKKSGKEPEASDRNLQTIVYLFVLGEFIKKNKDFSSFDYRHVNMSYWRPQSCETIGHLVYSMDKHETYGRLLDEKIRNIYHFDFDSFDKEYYSTHCKLCEFNWFCNGNRVDLKAMEEALEELDWDSVEEIF